MVYFCVTFVSIFLHQCFCTGSQEFLRERLAADEGNPEADS